MKKKTALHIAVEKGNIEIVKILLSFKKIDVNYIMSLYKLPNLYNETPLHIAVRNGNVEIVKLLLSCKNIDLNIYWKSYLLYCCTSYREEMTALYMAVKNENLEIVKILCQNPSIDTGKHFMSSINTGEQVIPPKRRFLEKRTPLNLASSLQNKEIYDYFNDEIKITSFWPS